MKRSDASNSHEHSGERNTFDDAVESVLRGLRDVRSAPDFESRLVRRLADGTERVRQARRPSWFLLWSGFRREARGQRLAFASAGLVGAVLLTVSLAASIHRQTSSYARLKVGEVHGGHPEAALSAAPVVARGGPAVVSSAVPTRMRVPQSKLRPASRKERIASFPAPPMPLTAQERLLLRAAHSDGPQRSALLDPDLRASVDRERGEEFHRFFIAATTIQQEELPN